MKRRCVLYDCDVVPEIPDALVRRSAVHEAGHTLVGLALGMSLEDVTLMDTFDPSGPQTQVGGGAAFRFEAPLDL